MASIQGVVDIDGKPAVELQGHESNAVVADMDVDISVTKNPVAGGDGDYNVTIAAEAAPVLEKRKSKSAMNSGDVRKLSRRVTEAGDDLTGLTDAEAEAKRETCGWNKLEGVVIPTWWLFVKQFVGAMPACIGGCVILSAVANDWLDFIIIIVLLILNACIGFTEELEAKHKLEALMKKVVQTITVKRNGTPQERPIEELVPGDIITVKQGINVPADCILLEGSVMMNTVAMTGESIPWKVPRPDDAAWGPGSGKQLWAGCGLDSGDGVAVVEKIAEETNIGKIFKDIQKDKAAGVQKSDYEKKILNAVAIIIFVAFLCSLFMFTIQGYMRQEGYQLGLLAMVGILVGSVPIALPLVLVVTMATGVSIMADHETVVSNMAALQDIASMTCLNSDKTGTLTTGDMAINYEKVWVNPNTSFSKEDVFEFAAICANRDNKKTDHIDGAILKKWDTMKGGDDEGKQYLDDHWKVDNKKKVGFHNVAKRTCHYVTRKGAAEMMISKGMTAKVLRCDDADEPAAGCEHPQWVCEGFDRLADEVARVNDELATDGFKTIAVAVQKDLSRNSVEFAGIVPMMDPPRHDTALTIQEIRKAGIEVKMITGDQLNIAKTTAREIGLGDEIYAAHCLREASEDNPEGYKTEDDKRELILKAEGFAQVKPEDKRACVENEMAVGWIVGMTGDGPNDGPALSAANIGIAVADAMDVAKDAADIQLQKDGLSAIFTAVVESRKIFRRLKAYVTFRIAATIQVILTLSIMTFVSGCVFDTIYIIIIAIANDLTMMPLSNDNQKASTKPEQPEVTGLLMQSTVYGILEGGMSIMFFYIACSFDFGFLNTMPISYHFEPTSWYSYIQEQMGTGPMATHYNRCMLSGVQNYGISTYCACEDYCKQLCCANAAGLAQPGQPQYGSVHSVCTEITTNAMFLQVFIAGELLIFPMRTISWMWTTIAAKWLYISVFVTLLLFTILSAEGLPNRITGLSDIFSQKLGWVNAGICWLWSLIGVFVMDVTKKYLIIFTEGVGDEIVHESIEAVAEAKGGDAKPTEAEIEQARSATKEAARRRSTAIQAGKATGVTNDKLDGGLSAGGELASGNMNPGRVARRVSKAI
jgi:H+-transporting ATPase